MNKALSKMFNNKSQQSSTLGSPQSGPEIEEEEEPLTVEDAVEAQAEPRQQQGAGLVTPPASISSHPVTSTRNDLGYGGPSSASGSAASQSVAGSGDGDFQTHLRKMTNNLMEIVDQMSHAASSTKGTLERTLFFVYLI